MEYVCPLCNGLKMVDITCPQCQSNMEDRGKVMDLFDDYSPYIEIEGLKQIDGIQNDKQNHECPHIFVCSECGKDVMHIVKEWRK
ncbi:hypothetical protein [Alkalihalobacterium bogoriense]|uniref:hypothetical protein n=1 Tax=Alkalihalobacterium bogoriense TaxID=246272 RepID=UPI00055517D4|nr:hypothetical protein [Alkalihalobacterium bogoriense]